MKKREILISAYGCEPLKGSESGVGWNWVLQLAKKNRLHVVTRANNRESIEAYLPEEIKEDIVFYYYDAPPIIRNMKHRAKGLYFYYFCWQLGIIPLVYSILKRESIAYTMHLTFGSIWMPTFLPLFGKTFIWGPIGGGDCEPKSFLHVLPLKQRIIQSARYVMNVTSFLNPFILLSSIKAAAILSRTPNTAKVVPFFSRHKVRLVLETAMEASIFSYHKAERKDKDVYHLITTGRLLPNKNILTAIRALHLVACRYKVKLTIVGSGWQRKEIDREIKRLKLWDKVVIIEEVERQEVLKLLEQQDIFLFPSLREGGSWALMEAMAVGLPVICLNWSGMTMTTDDSCAIRLSVTNPTQMSQDMADAIVKLIENPDLAQRMGRAGRNRVREHFNWNVKGEFMEHLLSELEQES